MEISEVRIKLMSDPNDRLKAFCSITLDAAFVIRDLKIIQGGKGPFVAMPSRKLTDKCPQCSAKNNLRSAFCNDCGHRLQADRALRGHDGRAKLYADVAHPINSECRDMIQESVLRSYEEELILARQPGYICRYDDYGEDTFATSGEEHWENPSLRSSDPVMSPPVGTHTAETRTAETRAADRQSSLAIPQVDSHAGEPLQGPHSSPTRESREREIAGVGFQRHDTNPDTFGEGII